MSGEATERELRSRRLLLSLSTMLATLLYTIDTTVANVALPTIQGNLAATREQASWVITSYLVASATALPALSAVTERFGLRRTFLASVLCFGLASGLCGLAPNIESLVIARFVQGLCGAALLPLGQTALQEVYPGPMLARAFALLGIGVMFGPVIGPSLGGWVTDELSWRAVFYINVPIVVLAALGLMATLRGAPEPQPRRFDWLGYALLAAGLICLQFAIDRGETLGWLDSAEIMVELLVAVLAAYMFVVHSMTCAAPLFDREMLANRNLSLSVVLSLLIGAPFMGAMVLMPAFLQEVQGQPVVSAGLLLAPRGLGVMVAMMMVGRIANTVDPRHLFALGCLLNSIGLYGMAQATADAPGAWLATWLLLQGFGLGLLFVPLNTIGFGTLAAHLRTEGAALVILARNVGSSIGVAVLVRLMSRDISANSAWLLERAHWVMSGDRDSTAWFLTQLRREATVIAYSNQYLLLAVIPLLLVPMIWLSRPPVPEAGGGPAIIEG
jgi:DHA2 family multidrug resistance protein